MLMPFHESIQKTNTCRSNGEIEYTVSSGVFVYKCEGLQCFPPTFNILPLPLLETSLQFFALAFNVNIVFYFIIDSKHNYKRVC